MNAEISSHEINPKKLYEKYSIQMTFTVHKRLSYLVTFNEGEQDIEKIVHLKFWPTHYLELCIIFLNVNH